MRYDAVVFDLFGTLIDQGHREDSAIYYDRLSSALALTIDDLKRALKATHIDRDTGRHGSLAGDMERNYTLLGRVPDPERIRRAIDIRLDFYGRALKPRDGALETLAALKSAGLKTALLSDCGFDIPMVWSSSQFDGLFDAVVFSCEEGICKPDPTGYRLACERIGVVPERCLYIGDGGSNELTGALAVGMHPALIRVAYEDWFFQSHPEAFEWTGPVISHLSEVLELAGLP